MATAAWLTEGFPDDAPAEDLLGRFACGECADNRDAAERDALQLSKAHALLRQIARVDTRPGRELVSEDARERVILAYTAAVAVLKARIELYFEKLGERA